MIATVDLDPRVLAAYPTLAGAAVRPFGDGLINRTYLVEGDAGRVVLQRVNPIFPAAIHDNILAVTRRELYAYFATPLAYVFLAIFLVLTAVFTFYIGNFFERRQADEDGDEDGEN